MNVIVSESPRGRPVTLHYREDTSDLSVLFSTFKPWHGPADDEYGLARTHVTGLALDIGAHIGTVTLALLADNPDCRVVAVEPIADNCAVLARSLEANGWTDRCDIVMAGIGTGKVPYGYSGSENAETNRFIGGFGHYADVAQSQTDVPVVSLSDLAPDGAAFAKFDCEGCEWKGLRDPAVAGIAEIVGEAHGDTKRQDWQTRLSRILGKTHELTFQRDDGGIGLFRAVRR